MCFFHIRIHHLSEMKILKKEKYKNYVLILENKRNGSFFVISTFKSLFIFKFQHCPISLKNSSSFVQVSDLIFSLVCQNEYTLMVHFVPHPFGKNYCRNELIFLISTNTFKFEYLQILNLSFIELFNASTMHTFVT